MKELYNYLTSCLTISYTIGNRMFPLLAPINTVKPYIVYHKVSESRGYTLKGYNSTRVIRYQISVYAETYKSATELSSLIKTALEDWIDVKIDVLTVENEIDLLDPEAKLYHTAIDFILTYKD